MARSTVARGAAPGAGIPTDSSGNARDAVLPQECVYAWRYLYENPGGNIFQTAELNEVLTAIIDAYDKAAAKLS